MPTNIENSVLGTFHQGLEMQRVSNVDAILCLQYCGLEFWKTNDLDKILIDS